ncbi:hypothetical protein [Nocardioides perillae]|uniref:Galactose oxidase n=1 Tax=Nocardioides perillae TaxID=1119534 RepID=A0A7Y9RXS7_9ACTN|nr:hypothetical protein [Nocardioides perillae]NYG56703.1 hypothetical protein [Nocardioides perillae]
MRPRLLLVVLAVVAVLATACGSGVGTRAGGPEAVGEWRRLPDLPLSPRTHAVVVGVEVAGSPRALVVGGWELLCPPGADCSYAGGPLFRDGAVYDPADDTWTPTAPAPHGVRRHERATVGLGGSAWLLTSCASGVTCEGRERLLQYDLAADRWTDHGAVPGPERYRALVAVGDRLLVPTISDEGGEAPDLLFDPATGAWRELPDDPLADSFDRFAVPVGEQLVLKGSSIEDVRAGRSATVSAARFDLDSWAWTTLPDAPVPGFQLVGSDRGPVLVGHFVETSGAVLDPATWAWSRLPEPGADPRGRTSQLGGVLGRGGAAYDVPNSVGEMTSRLRVLLWDAAAQAYVELPAMPERRDEVHDDSSAALGRDLLVVGGQRWPGGAVGGAAGGSGSGEGELVREAWLWLAPGPS